MLGVQNDGHAEGVHDLRGGFFTESHPEEVLRVVQILARFNQLLTATAALVVANHGGHDGEQFLRLAQLGLGRGIFGLRVLGSDHGCGRAAHVHGVTVRGQRVNDLLQFRGQRTVGAFALLEVRELILGGQLPGPQQQRDFLGGALGGQLLHRVTAVQQRVGLGVDLGHSGGVGDDAGKTLANLGFGHGDLLVRVWSIT